MHREGADTHDLASGPAAVVVDEALPNLGWQRQLLWLTYSHGVLLGRKGSACIALKDEGPVAILPDGGVPPALPRLIMDGDGVSLENLPEEALPACGPLGSLPILFSHHTPIPFLSPLAHSGWSESI